MLYILVFDYLILPTIGSRRTVISHLPTCSLDAVGFCSKAQVIPFYDCTSLHPPRRDVSLPHNEDLRKSYFYTRAFTLCSLFPSVCINVATIWIVDRIARGISQLVVKIVSGLSVCIIADFSTTILCDRTINWCARSVGGDPGEI